jgi:hypothetical protein
MGKLHEGFPLSRHVSLRETSADRLPHQKDDTKSPDKEGSILDI